MNPLGVIYTVDNTLFVVKDFSVLSWEAKADGQLGVSFW
jgi:hypothetical protein